MRATVFGPGGVGGYLAARLAAAGAAEVSVVGRGRHLEAVRRDGLRLASPGGDAHVRVQATEDPAQVGPVDLVLLTVKATDVPTAAASLAPLLGPDTAVATFQNGITAPGQVAEAVGDDRTVPGVAYIFSTISSPGTVHHTAGPARFVFGTPRGVDGVRARRLADLFTAAGIDHELVDDVDVAMWSKFAIICATAGVTAPSRLPIDVLREDPAALQLFRALGEETAAVGRAAGVALPDDVVDRVMDLVASVGPGASSSLLYDLEHGKPMELDTLHGTVVQLGDELGVPVPATRTVHALLSPWARRNAAGPRASASG